MLMCIKNLVRFCQFILKILSGNKILTEQQNDRMTEGHGESSIAPLFQSGAIMMGKSIRQIWVQLTGTVDGRTRDTGHSTVGPLPLDNCHSSRG